MGGYVRTARRSLHARRRFAGLAAATVVVLALLTVFAIELSDTQAKSRRDVIARVHERSMLAAALIDSLLHSAEQQVGLLEARYGGRVVRARALNAARQQNLYLAVLDRHGHVLASSAGFTAQAHGDLARSAALALVRAGHPYGLGDVLPYRKSGVVNLAIAFPTRYGRRYLLSGIAPRSLSGFLGGELQRIPGVQGAHNYVIDGNDTVLASTNPAYPAGYRFTSQAIVAALRSPSGDRHGHYFDQSRVSNSTWRIVLAAPDGPLFASVSGLRKWLPWLIFAAFALVAAAALLLGGRLLRSAEEQLREANARLGAVNQELEAANAKLAHDALHDPLTRLPNRTLFMDRLEQMLERCRRDHAFGCAVLFLDLNNFKPVNDRLSHAIGDQVLHAVAIRMRQALRPGDTVARIGGDEFVILLDGVQTEEDARVVAKRVHDALAAPIEVSGHRVTVGASIGIALGSVAVTGSELLRNADMAMYEEKRRGTGEHLPSPRGLTLT